PCVATALWTVFISVKGRAEVDRPQAGGYSTCEIALASIWLARSLFGRQDSRGLKEQLSMKVGVIQTAIRQTAFAAVVGGNLLIVPNVSAQAIAPPAQVTMGGTAEVERVIVTGSNIPTAEETGPNPVDTYRPADIEKLG